MNILCLLVLIGLGACQSEMKESLAEEPNEQNQWSEELKSTDDESREEYDFGDGNQTNGTLTAEVASNQNEARPNVSDGKQEGVVRAFHDLSRTDSKPMLIQKVDMELRVDDLPRGRAQLDSLLDRYQAYLAHELYAEQSGTKGYELTIKVPAQYLEFFLKGSKGIEGELRSFGRNSEDVKAQYIDQATRLATKRKVLERYEAILGRAGKISEVLEAEREIRNLIEEIEATEGRLKYLREQSAYASLNVHLFQWVEAEPLTAQLGYGDKVLAALASGGNGVLALVLFLIQIWPILLLVPVFILAWRKRRGEVKTA